MMFKNILFFIIANIIAANDLTLIGDIKFSDGLARQPIWIIDNLSNDLQINWKNEFINKDYVSTDYINKVHSLLLCIQKSVKDMIEKTRKFAETDFKDILN